MRLGRDRVPRFELGLGRDRVPAIREIRSERCGRSYLRRRLLKVLCPEGTNEGSLARSAWKMGRRDPSRRVRYDSSGHAAIVLVHPGLSNPRILVL